MVGNYLRSIIKGNVMRVFFLITGLFISVLWLSCEDSRLDGMYEDKIGFLKNGEQMITAYIAKSYIEFESPVYKSGIGTDKAQVTVNVDQQLLDEYNEKNSSEFEILPQDCYSIENREFQLSAENDNVVVKVKIDVKKLEALQGVQFQKYAIPLQLKTSGEIELSSNRSDLILIPEITGGIRPNSEVSLFKKSFADMGIDQTNHNTASFAVTSKYLFVNTRNEDLKYYDRFTGEYKGSIPLSFKASLANFTVTNDENDNLLITNLRNAASGLALQTIYRIKGTGLPEKYIEFSHIYPNGRKLSITGDLDKDAIITSTVENSSRVVYWTVKNGVLTSQEPQVYTADPSRIAWINLADAVAVDVNIDAGMYIVGTGGKSNFGFYDKNGESIAEYDLLGGGLDPSVFRNQSLSYATFNGARYLALGSQQSNVAMYTTLLDVTKPENLKLNPNSQKLIAYKGPAIVTTVNTNATADVHIKVSEDKETMVIYSLGTNGSIEAVQFDCKLEE